MITLISIGSEHQLFQVRIALNTFKINESNVIYFIEDTGIEKKFIQTLIESKKYSNVIVYDTWIFKDLLFKKDKYRAFIKKCYSIKNEYLTDFNLLYSEFDTDANLLIQSIFSPKKSILLDEGTAIFNVLEKRDKTIISTSKLLIKSLVYQLKINLPSSIVFFTKYNIKCSKYDSIVKYQEQSVLNEVKLSDEKIMYFLGSSVVELNIIKLPNYISALRKIKKINKSIRILYFSHRKENKEKLKIIESIGYEVISNQAPFEELFRNLEVWPSNISSFHFTTVLDNISMKFTNWPKLIVYKFPENNFVKERNAYNQIFLHLENNRKLNIINTNNDND